MEPIPALIAGAVGYLLGSLSFARIVVGLFAPQVNIAEGASLVLPGAEESLHLDVVSGTAVAAKLGERYGCLTAILDMLKVAAPTLAFQLAYPDASYFLLTAIMGVVGHNWPLYYQFKGGRGLSAIYGGLLVIDPIGTVVTSIVALVLGLLIKNVFVCYSGGTWLMIPWIWFRTGNPAYLVYVVAVNIIYLVALIPEIRIMRDRRWRLVQSDFDMALGATPMGRGLKKMAARLGVPRDGQ